MKLIFILLISSIIYGIVDALFEIYFEERFEKNIYYYTKDDILANVLTSTLSSAIAILIYTFIEEHIKLNKYKYKRPIYDSIGTIIGGILVYIVYNVYKSKKIINF